jgi:2'-5' RNA ligase
LGVALLVDYPTGLEVAGLRRALGDPSLETVPAHITLVPPVNVKVADLARALAVMRAAASSVSGPFELTLGPPASFLPDNPVCYLAVGGEPSALHALRTVRDTVFAEPLARKLSWPWVPHVTILDGGEPEKIGEALRCLGSYTAKVTFDRVVLLELRPDRSWRPRADALLGRRVRVATGGLPVDVTFSRLPDAEGSGDWPGRVARRRHLLETSRRRRVRRLARLGPARLGPARLGPARLGPARLGSADCAGVRSGPQGRFAVWAGRSVGGLLGAVRGGVGRPA